MWVSLMNGCRDGLREREVARGLVVESTVRFDMLETHAQLGGDLLEIADLFPHEFEYFTVGEHQFATTEICAVAISGVRAKGDAVRAGKFDSVAHGYDVAGVTSARNV